MDRAALQFLNAREQELRRQLASVLRAKAALLADATTEPPEQAVSLLGAEQRFGIDLVAAGEARPPTVANIILLTLTEHFRNGATKAQLKTYLSQQWRARPTPGVLAIQFNRLKNQGLLRSEDSLWVINRSKSIENTAVDFDHNNDGPPIPRP